MKIFILIAVVFSFCFLQIDAMVVKTLNAQDQYVMIETNHKLYHEYIQALFVAPNYHSMPKAADQKLTLDEFDSLIKNYFNFSSILARLSTIHSDFNNRILINDFNNAEPLTRINEICYKNNYQLITINELVALKRNKILEIKSPCIVIFDVNLFLATNGSIKENLNRILEVLRFNPYFFIVFIGAGNEINSEMLPLIPISHCYCKASNNHSQQYFKKNFSLLALPTLPSKNLLDQLATPFLSSHPKLYGRMLELNTALTHMNNKLHFPNADETIPYAHNISENDYVLGDIEKKLLNHYLFIVETYVYQLNRYAERFLIHLAPELIEHVSQKTKDMSLLDLEKFSELLRFHILLTHDKSLNSIDAIFAKYKAL